MKFRPQVQLRFRDAAQFLQIKQMAREEFTSVNEWVLRRIESKIGQEGGNGVARESGRDVAAAHLQTGDMPTMRRKSKADASGSGQAKGKAESGHDPKTCRVYKCGTCAVLTGGQK